MLMFCEGKEDLYLTIQQHDSPQEWLGQPIVSTTLLIPRRRQVAVPPSMVWNHGRSRTGALSSLVSSLVHLGRTP